MEMKVHPSSDLEIQLQNTGIVSFETNALELLKIIGNYIRQTAIAWYFEYGQLPPTWAEVKARQQTEPPNGRPDG